MSESTKYETISLRLAKNDADLIRAYAESERVSVSALIRSSMLRLIRQEDKVSQSVKSPSPALDKLSFDTRFKLLRVIDITVACGLASGDSLFDVETRLLKEFDVSDSKVFQDLLSLEMLE